MGHHTDRLIVRVIVGLRRPPLYAWRTPSSDALPAAFTSAPRCPWYYRMLDIATTRVARQQRERGLENKRFGLSILMRQVNGRDGSAMSQRHYRLGDKSTGVGTIGRVESQAQEYLVSRIGD